MSDKTFSQTHETDHNADGDKMVSSRAVIDVIESFDVLDGYQDKVELVSRIEALPAQPEIIRCQECKHWREGIAFSYCDKLHGMGVLDALDYMTAEDDYCSMAERRTDEGET